MTLPLPPMQGLWIGPTLSVLEQLSVSSFLHNGHAYHLYVYDEVQHIPAGTRVMDANEILPASLIFQYQDFPSYAGFANLFRYKLLLEKGGWWVDSDMVCLKPFDFADEYVFAAELDWDRKAQPTCGVIRVPAASEVMTYAWQTSQSKASQQLLWGETGPRLMATAIRRCGLERYVKPAVTFCPVAYEDWERFVDAEYVWCFDETTYAVHLWNEMWRRSGRDKDQSYHPGCLYERLKAYYGLGTSRNAAYQDASDAGLARLPVLCSHARG